MLHSFLSVVKIQTDILDTYISCSYHAVNHNLKGFMTEIWKYRVVIFKRQLLYLDEMRSLVTNKKIYHHK